MSNNIKHFRSEEDSKPSKEMQTLVEDIDDQKLIIHLNEDDYKLAQRFVAIPATIVFRDISPPISEIDDWLWAKVKLTGTTNDIISRNIKKDAAVKYSIRRDVSALTTFTSEYYRKYLKF
jgi:hypothetical protein